MTIGWELSDPDAELEEKFGGKKGLAGIARHRSGYPVDDDNWVVVGEPKHGDGYPDYQIRFDGTKYHCSCQGHAGGQYRKLCSHVVYVIFARRGIVPFITSLDESRGVGEVREKPQPRQQTNPKPLSTPLPVFVDQGQPPTGGSREALDNYFHHYANEPLPDWVKLLRLQQWDALNEIVDHLQGGKRVVFVDAPTGAGKSLLGEMVRRKVSPHRGIYTCSTKTLQDQFERDFPYGKVIKGRSNYPTLDYPDWDAEICDISRLTYPACRKDPKHYQGVERGEQFQHCSFCHPVYQCPYRVAKQEAFDAPLAIANISYLLYETNGAFSVFAGAPLVIVDEADTLEDQLMGYITVTFSPYTLKELRIGMPELKTVSKAWGPWLETVAIPAIKNMVWLLKGRDDYKGRKRRVFYERLLDKAQIVAESIDEEWIYTGYERGYVEFKPIKVEKFAQEVLWSKAHQWVLMSATIISAQQMAVDLGLTRSEWASVEVPSSFPPERRPIYVEPTANMTFKNKATAWPKMATRISELAREYPNDRILVHTVSYALAEVVTKAVGVRAVTYRNAEGRQKALDLFRESKNGVLVASSFDRGIDLPYDECRVVVIAKIPYPNTTDKQINKRLYSKNGQGWYTMQTVRSLVQMSGRAMRFEDDFCEIYLLDTQFVKNIAKNKGMLPTWWRDALVTERKG